MASMTKRLRVLFITAWYPSKENPVSGIFVKEHAKTVQLHNDVIVVYAREDPSLKGLWQLCEDIEDEIRTIRIRYGGLLGYLKEIVYREDKSEENHGLQQTSLRAPSIRNILTRLPLAMANDLLYCWSVFVAFRRLLRQGWRPDIIHAHVFTAGVPAVVLGKLYGIPVVLTEHWTSFQRHQLTRYQLIKARYAMRRARIILPVSDDLKGHIQSYGIENRFEVVPNTVDCIAFCPTCSDEDRRTEEFKRMLLVSLITPLKGIPYLLEALHQISMRRQDFILDIIGDGPNRLEYEALSSKLGINQMVKFHGLKAKVEVVRFMQQCDFYVQPSLFETFGVTFIEVMACGKPIVATRLPALEVIIGKEAGILVPSQDVPALTEAIKYMLDHYQDYSSEKIAKYPRNNFSHKVVGKKLNDIYREMLQPEL